MSHVPLERFWGSYSSRRCMMSAGAPSSCLKVPSCWPRRQASLSEWEGSAGRNYTAPFHALFHPPLPMPPRCTRLTAIPMARLSVGKPAQMFENGDFGRWNKPRTGVVTNSRHYPAMHRHTENIDGEEQDTTEAQMVGRSYGKQRRSRSGKGCLQERRPR